ncbi:hypothetical protein D9M69_519400 [compost metagenome]
MAKAPVTKAVNKAAAPKKAATAAAGKEPALIAGIFVRSLPPTFRRAGIAFTREGVGLRLVDLTERQRTAIEDEPLLNVQHCDFPATEEDDALLAAHATSADSPPPTVQADDGSANQTANPMQNGPVQE